MTNDSLKKYDYTKNIALIGPYPPPYGGVSIHIQRVKSILEKENINMVIYNLGHRGVSYTKSVVPNVINVKYPILWILRFLITSKEDIIHNHYFDWRLAVIFGLMGLIGKEMLISIHSEEFFPKDNWLKRKLVIFALKRYSFIIAANNDIKNICFSIGIDKSNVKVIPAFITPTIKQEEINEITNDVWDFIETHGPVISANASFIDFINNEEVYGIDMCIDLCEQLKNKYKNIGFIFLLSKIGDNEYFEKMKERIANKNLEDNFRLINLSCQFYPILMKSDLFIRPTNTDGDAISVREALSMKVPTVASDVVGRPNGTISFKSRDLNDLCSKVENVLKDYKSCKKKLEEINLGDSSKKFLDVYKKLTNRN